MKLWKILGVELYEVGDIFLNMSGKNPGLRFKGTWELIAKGQTLVGVDTSQTEFNSVRKSGGSKTHKLTVNEMPSHNHPLGFRYGTDSAGSNYELSYNGFPLMGTGPGARGYTPNRMKNTGEGRPHNNLQPYLTTYIWERVS